MKEVNWRGGGFRHVNSLRKVVHWRQQLELVMAKYMQAEMLVKSASAKQPTTNEILSYIRTYAAKALSTIK